MEFFEIILQIIGALAIVVGGYFMVLFGGLGNTVPVYLSGMGVYIFGVFTTAMTIFISVFGVDPNNTAIYGISIFIAGFISVAHYRKIFVNKKRR